MCLSPICKEQSRTDRSHFITMAFKAKVHCSTAENRCKEPQVFTQVTLSLGPVFLSCGESSILEVFSLSVAALAQGYVTHIHWSHKLPKNERNWPDPWLGHSYQGSFRKAGFSGVLNIRVLIKKTLKNWWAYRITYSYTNNGCYVCGCHDIVLDSRFAKSGAQEQILLSPVEETATHL